MMLKMSTILEETPRVLKSNKTVGLNAKRTLSSAATKLNAMYGSHTLKSRLNNSSDLLIISLAESNIKKTYMKERNIHSFFDKKIIPKISRNAKKNTHFRGYL